jgi:hypothetical protein
MMDPHGCALSQAAIAPSEAATHSPPRLIEMITATTRGTAPAQSDGAECLKAGGARQRRALSWEPAESLGGTGKVPGPSNAASSLGGSAGAACSPDASGSGAQRRREGAAGSPEATFTARSSVASLRLREEAAAGALAARREEICEDASVLPLPRLAGARVRGGERACRAWRVPTRGRAGREQISPVSSGGGHSPRGASAESGVARPRSGSTDPEISSMASEHGAGGGGEPDKDGSLGGLRFHVTAAVTGASHQRRARASFVHYAVEVAVVRAAEAPGALSPGGAASPGRGAEWWGIGGQGGRLEVLFPQTRLRGAGRLRTRAGPRGRAASAPGTPEACSVFFTPLLCRNFVRRPCTRSGAASATLRRCTRGWRVRHPTRRCRRCQERACGAAKSSAVRRRRPSW